MLRIVNQSGEELMNLQDDGTEEIKSQQLKEQMDQAKLSENKEG